MAFINQFTFAPAEWLPIRNQELLDKISLIDINEHQGNLYENPAFEVKVCADVHNYFATDLFHRIRMSDIQDKKLVMILPSPENAVFISLAGVTHMSNITFHRCHMTAVPTDLLLDPTTSIEAKAFAGILRAISEGNHSSEELAILLNIPEEKIFPALSELKELRFLSVEDRDGIFQLNIM